MFQSLPFEAGKPNGIIAHTHKGKGVSFIQDRAEWHHHHRALSNEEMAAALVELGGGDQESGSRAQGPEAGWAGLGTPGLADASATRADESAR